MATPPRLAAGSRLVAAAALAAVLGAAWTLWWATARPRIDVRPVAIDFGPLARAAVQDVEIRNTGRRTLRILGVSSSCGCTTGRLGASEIPAGRSVVLFITFDPAKHGPQTGPARHAVYVRTNDARAPEVEIPVRAVVLEPRR